MRTPALLLTLLLASPLPLATHAGHHGARRGAAADNVLAAARSSVATINDTTAARAAGYVPIEELGIPNRNPFQGRHWYKGANADTLREVRLATPSFVMFSPVNGSLQRVAVAYSTRLRLPTAVPASLGLDSTAMWHVHILCEFKRPEGPPLVDQIPDTAACRARGGAPFPRKTVMVHVWTDVTKPEGVYGHDNPALPYIAVGLSANAQAALHNPARTRDARALAMALGETYGMRLEEATVIERVNTNSALADSLRAHRAAITALLPTLRQADQSNDASAFDRVAQSMRAEEERLIQIYQLMARSPDEAALMRRDYEQTLTTSAMH